GEDGGLESHLAAGRREGGALPLRGRAVAHGAFELAEERLDRREPQALGLTSQLVELARETVGPGRKATLKRADLRGELVGEPGRLRARRLVARCIARCTRQAFCELHRQLAYALRLADAAAQRRDTPLRLSGRGEQRIDLRTLGAHRRRRHVPAVCRRGAYR